MPKRSKKREPQKPTGEIGPLLVAPGVADFQPVQRPARKADIELQVLRPFLLTAAGVGFLDFEVTSEPKVNATDDFDFSIETTSGDKYVELLEVAPLGAGAYEAAPSSYDVYEFADWIATAMFKKARRYIGATELGIVLVTYSTHWAFVPNDEVLFLLSCWTHTRNHCFESIYHTHPLDDHHHSVSRIFPIPGVNFERLDPEAFRGRTVLNLRPHRWIPISW